MATIPWREGEKGKKFSFPSHLFKIILRYFQKDNMFKSHFDITT